MDRAPAGARNGGGRGCCENTREKNSQPMTLLYLKRECELKVIFFYQSSKVNSFLYFRCTQGFSERIARRSLKAEQIDEALVNKTLSESSRLPDPELLVRVGKLNR